MKHTEREILLGIADKVVAQNPDMHDWYMARLRDMGAEDADFLAAFPGKEKI